MPWLGYGHFLLSQKLTFKMPKRPETTDTLTLALQILRRIPRQRKITAKELHQQLTAEGIERDIRTIQRLLKKLCEEFDIEQDNRARPYGYRWKEQAEGFAVHSLTTQESLLLQLAEEHLRHLLPARLMQSMDGFFSQAKRNLIQEPDAELERQWRQKVRVVSTSQPLLPPKVDWEVFQAVSDALYGNFWLHIDYRNARGKQTQAEVMPLALAQQGTRLYLVCRFNGYNNERSLALNRLVSAKKSNMSFGRPEDFDLKRFDDEGRFGFGDGKKIRLTFRISRAAGLHLLESKLSSDQTHKVIDENTLEITATVINSEMLDWWLRGFGDALSEVRQENLG